MEWGITFLKEENIRLYDNWRVLMFLQEEKQIIRKTITAKQGNIYVCPHRELFYLVF